YKVTSGEAEHSYVGFPLYAEKVNMRRISGRFWRVCKSSFLETSNNFICTSKANFARSNAISASDDFMTPYLNKRNGLCITRLKAHRSPSSNIEPITI